MDEVQRRGPGRPKGSKNKPKPTGRQRTVTPGATADEAIQANLTALIDTMIKSAVEDGDVMSAKYLIDRILGRPTERRENVGDQRIVIELADDWRG